LRLRLLPFNSTARRVLLIWLLIVCACASGAALRNRAGAQELKRRGAENTHGILSEVPLTALDAAISADGGLLSATEEGGRLLLYDLKTATRRNVYTLPNDVVYERFSSDGKRLLALTQDQIVYILDATALSQESP